MCHYVSWSLFQWRLVPPLKKESYLPSLWILRAMHPCHVQVVICFLVLSFCSRSAWPCCQTINNVSIVYYADNCFHFRSLSHSFPIQRSHSCPYSFSLFLLFSLEEICAELVSAIEAGDVRAASVCASSLAKQRAALSIQPSKHNYTDTEIR